MLNRRSDLPLDRDAISRFLPWLIAFMVFLAVLALAGTLVLGSMAARWDRGMSGTLTVQIAPPPPTDDRGADRGTDRGADRGADRIARVLKVLRDTPGVARAEPIDEGRMLALLEPWLGSGPGAVELPLPRLIDVVKEPDRDIDMAALEKRLAEVAPGASVDDHGVWLERLLRLIHTIEALSLSVVILIGFATVGTVVFATRTGLAIHQDVIEVLHLIGAHDSYIAKQFASHALALGVRGGLLGLGLAVPTLLGIGSLAARLESGPLPDLSLAPAHWAVLAVLPPVVAVIAMLTARITVTRSLARML